MNRPNIFDYATSELSQDAFLCWLFEHLSSEEYVRSKEANIARKLLNSILQGYGHLGMHDAEQNDCYRPLPVYVLTELRTHSIRRQDTQKKRRIDKRHDVKFDVTCGGKPVARVLIEDKTRSEESFHKQLLRYWQDECATTDMPVIPVFWKTDYVCALRREELQNECVLVAQSEIEGAFAGIEEWTDNRHEILCGWWKLYKARYAKPITAAVTAVDSCAPSDRVRSVFEKLQQEPEKSTAAFADRFIQKAGLPKLLSEYHGQFSVQRGKGHSDLLWIYGSEYWTITPPDERLNEYAIKLQFLVQAGRSKTPQMSVKTIPLGPERPGDYLRKGDMAATPEFAEYYRGVQHRLRTHMEGVRGDEAKLTWRSRKHHLMTLALSIDESVSLQSFWEALEHDIPMLLNGVENFLKRERAH